MLVPLALLALGAVLAGQLFHEAFIGHHAGHEFWQGAVAFDPEQVERMHGVPLWVKLSATSAMLVGLLIAFYAYIRNTAFPRAFVENFRLLYAFLLNKWYFDEIYNVLIVRPAMWIGRFLWKKGDEGTIDRFGPDGVAAAVVAGTRLTARIQTGYLYTYALVMLLGVAAAVTWAMAQ
jgi:NADH-quinone oxidoreductase subunit L